MEEEKSEERGKKHLCVIKYRDDPGGCAGIGLRNGKLRTGGGEAGKDQIYQLPGLHRVVKENKIRQADEAGKG